MEVIASSTNAVHPQGLLTERTRQVQNRNNNSRNRPTDEAQKKKLANFESQQVQCAALPTTVHTEAPAPQQPVSVPRQHQHQPYLLRPLSELGRDVVLTVVFDLDETLVYNRRMDINYAILRPYALHMLNAIRAIRLLHDQPAVEIVLWTASTAETAAPVVDQLHERGLVFDELIYRNDLWFRDVVHTKDLRLLGRDMNRVVIVDNQPNCVKLNPASAILVEDYLGGTDAQAMEDATLVNLYYMIEALVSNCAKGVSVSETLCTLASEADERCRLCCLVTYLLPPAWANVDLRGMDPLDVPPHGHHVRACSRTPAPLEHWTA